MRFFVYILFLYFLALSILPCSDGLEQCLDNGETEISLFQHDHDHSDHQNDHCTPFCSCACCGSLTTFDIENSIVDIKELILSTYISFYKFDYSFDYSEGVWHPPSFS